MNNWEYLIVSLPKFESLQHDQGESTAVSLLNQEGKVGWEAVGLTPMANGASAVLLKRALPQSRASGGRM